MVYVDRIGLFYYEGNVQQSSTSNASETNTNRKSGSYSREAAVTYSQEWNNDRNPDYIMAKFPWSIKTPWDCANFVSQVLHAGGINIRSDWFNNSGEFNFLGRRTDKNYSTNWTTAKGLSNWLRKQEDIYNGESLLRNGENFKSDLNKALELTKIGDVIGWSKDENGKDIHHVGIITKIENGRLYYDAHTTDRNMAEVNFAGDKSIVIIHIKEEAE